jgi:predicted esterase
LKTRLTARFAVGIGLCLLAYAGAKMAASPQSAPLPPAAYVESQWQGRVPDAPAKPDYHSSASITVAGWMHESGIWPFKQSWYEYAPAGRKPKAAVVLLHGAGRDGLSMLDMWQATADRHDLLLIAPNEGPLRFGALGRHAVTATARDAAKAHGLAATDSPMRLYLGDRDPIFPTAPAKASLQAMATMGHTAELVEIKGHAHWFYGIGPDIAEDSWRWFGSLVP